MSENATLTENTDASLAQYTDDDSAQPNALGDEPLPEEERGACPHVRHDDVPCWPCYRDGDIEEVDDE